MTSLSYVRGPLHQLEWLVGAWREHRDPGLAELVQRLGAKISLPMAGPHDNPKLKGQKLQTAWVEAILAAKSEHWGALLPGIAGYVANARYTWPVVEALAGVDPDPRIARTAIGWLASFDKLAGGSGKLWRRVVDCVERHGDAGLAPALRSMKRQTLYDQENARLENVAKRLEKARKPFDSTALAAEVEAFVAPAVIEPRVQTPEAAGEDLLAAIYADPSNDAPRAVYADWLSSRGDPRGEFISLQLLPSLEGRAAKRAAALQKQHAHERVAPLWPLTGQSKKQPIGELRFERGFLASVGGMVPRRHDHLLAHPLWRLVTELDFEVGRFGSAMSNVARVGCISAAGLASLRAFSYILPVEDVVLRPDGADGELAKPLPQLANVRRASVFVGSGRGGRGFGLVRRLLEQPWPHLESITVRGCSYVDWYDSWDWALLDRAPSTFRELRLPMAGNHHDEEWLTLRRTAKGWTDAHMTASDYRDREAWTDVAQPFSGARRLDTLTIEGTGEVTLARRKRFLSFFAGAARTLVPAGTLA